jgi:hypothetical protein
MHVLKYRLVHENWESTFSARLQVQVTWYTDLAKAFLILKKESYDFTEHEEM